MDHMGNDDEARRRHLEEAAGTLDASQDEHAGHDAAHAPAPRSDHEMHRARHEIAGHDMRSATGHATGGHATAGHATAGHAAHGKGHDKHAGHSVAMFRDRFWLSLLLTIPVLIWSHNPRMWFG